MKVFSYLLGVLLIIIVLGMNIFFARAVYDYKPHGYCPENKELKVCIKDNEKLERMVDGLNEMLSSCMLYEEWTGRDNERH